MGREEEGLEMTRYTRTPEELQEELKMMQNPDNWPMWPQLPIKRRQEGAQGQIGVLLETDFSMPIKPTVYLKNLWNSDIEEVEKIKYKEWLDLLDDGWVVD